MNQKQILQSLLLRIPAIKQTKKAVVVTPIKQNFKDQQDIAQELGLNPKRHPNETHRPKIGKLPVIDIYQNHRKLDLFQPQHLNLYRFNRHTDYVKQGTMTVVQNGTMDFNGPQKDWNVVYLTQLQASRSI